MQGSPTYTLLDFGSNAVSYVLYNLIFGKTKNSVIFRLQ